MTAELPSRSGAIHDRVFGYLNLIDALDSEVGRLRQERVDALGALTMLDTGAPGSLADKINELRSLWVEEAKAALVKDRLHAALLAILAWPTSDDPALACERATREAHTALSFVKTPPVPGYTEEEIRMAVKYVSGREAATDTIDYLRSKRTTP